MIRSVAQENIDSVWPSVVGYIDDACSFSNGTIDAEDVHKSLVNGTMQLYVCGDLEGAFVTEIQKYNSKTVVRIVCLGGEPGACDFEDITNTMLAWAKELDAVVELIGRKGWVKALKRFGWKQTSVIMEVSNE